MNETYKQGFVRLWEDKSSGIVPNSLPEHAAALISVFFEKAERRVAIFCRNLAPEVYGDKDLISAAQSALARKVKIEVVVQDAPDTSTDFYKFITGNKNSDGTDILVNKPPAPKPVNEVAANFAFVDERAFRLEPDRGSVNAVASAYHPQYVEKLITYFEDIKKRCLLAQPAQ